MQDSPEPADDAGSGRGALIVIALALFFIGGIAAALGGTSLLSEWRYQRQAIRTNARVTDKTLHLATDTSDTSYELSYRVEADDQTFAHKAGADVHVWERVAPNDVVLVEYLPGEPTSVRLVTGTSNDNVTSVAPTALGALLILSGLALVRHAVRRRLPVSSAPRRAMQPSDAPIHAPSYWPLARRSSDFWLGAIFLAVGAPVLVAMALRFHNEWRFSREARLVTGITLTKEITTSGRGQRTRHYEATYRFNVPEGVFEGRTRVPYDTWTQLTERKPADVLYLPAAPMRNRLNAPQPWIFKAFVMLLACLFTGLGGTFFVRAVRHARREWRSVPSPHERNA